MPQHLSLLPNLEMYSLSGIVLIDFPFPDTMTSLLELCLPPASRCLTYMQWRLAPKALESNILLLLVLMTIYPYVLLGPSCVVDV